MTAGWGIYNIVGIVQLWQWKFMCLTSINGKISVDWKSKNAIISYRFQFFASCFLQNVENLVRCWDTSNVTSGAELTASEWLRSESNWKFAKINRTKNIVIFL